MSNPDPVSSAPSHAPPPTELDPPPTTRYSNAATPASVLSPGFSSHSAGSSWPSLQCSREQENMLGSLVDTLSPTTMARLLSTFANAPVASGPPASSQPLVAPTYTTTVDTRLGSSRPPIGRISRPSTRWSPASTTVQNFYHLLLGLPLPPTNFVLKRLPPLTMHRLVGMTYAR